MGCRVSECVFGVVEGDGLVGGGKAGDFGCRRKEGRVGGEVGVSRDVGERGVGLGMAETERLTR